MASNSTATADLPQDTRGAVVIAVISVLLPIAIAIVSLRFFVRSRLLHAVGPDDWLILVALVRQFLPKKSMPAVACSWG
jgi:hypothetical protein